MAQNPLLGSRISLISKKNIRYEGTLYSINESNATVALQNVRSYGTEGREKLDPTCTFVAPQDSVHPYLLFRGCDIKDLHVHENAVAQPPSDPAIMSSDAPAEAAATPQQSAPPKKKEGKPEEEKKQAPSNQKAASDAAAAKNDTKPSGNKGKGPGQGPKKGNTNSQVGTGASLLNRKVRGTKDGGLSETPAEEFDFQSKLKEFEKEHDEEEDDEAGDAPAPIANGTGHSTSYEKDDFFDSISCDVLDREAGIDNRLRGSAERNLNTETFGAVALNSQRRRGGGRGRGGGGGRGRGGRGRGRGRGRGGRGRGRGGQPQTQAAS